MKKLTLFALLIVLSGCGNHQTVYVWNMTDVIGLVVLCIGLLVVAVAVLYTWISDKIAAAKRNRR